MGGLSLFLKAQHPWAACIPSFSGSLQVEALDLPQGHGRRVRPDPGQQRSLRAQPWARWAVLVTRAWPGPLQSPSSSASAHPLPFGAHNFSPCSLLQTCSKERTWECPHIPPLQRRQGPSQGLDPEWRHFWQQVMVLVEVSGQGALLAPQNPYWQDHTMFEVVCVFYSSCSTPHPSPPGPQNSAQAWV